MCLVDSAENLGSYCEREKGVSLSFLGPLRKTLSTTGPKQSVMRKREAGRREAGSAGGVGGGVIASCQGT